VAAHQQLPGVSQNGGWRDSDVKGSENNGIGPSHLEYKPAHPLVQYHLPTRLGRNDKYQHQSKLVQINCQETSTLPRQKFGTLQITLFFPYMCIRNDVRCTVPCLTPWLSLRENTIAVVKVP
jgi:hypothetical protein